MVCCIYMHNFLTCMYMFACMHFSLSSMIEATWRWAAEHNKIIKHPISGGEFVDVDVEKMSRHIHEEGSGMTQSSNVTFEAYLISKCMYGSFFFSCMICRTPADLCWTLSRIQMHKGAPKIRLRCLQSRF